METLNLIYYSPTGTTQKIVKKIAEELKLKLLKEYSLTSRFINFNPKFSNNCLTIIGLPVYGGRLPLETAKKLKKLQAKNAKVVIVVVYGNRAYEDSLLELKDIVTNCGFKIIAAAAFIGEHSYSTKDKAIAAGRPDEFDLIKCTDFAHRIQTKINDLKDEEEILDLDIPGNFPYKERVTLTELIAPETNDTKCNNCGICVDVCPTNAIEMNQFIITNKELCTRCCACVKNCPTGARVFENPSINSLRERLYSICSDRKEPEFFV